METLIGEQTSNRVVVYSGRFQPFHKGHFATYQLLTKKFGKENVYIGTTNKTDNIKSPFGFKEKKYIITKMFGIPANKIVQIKNPYAPVEILDKYDSMIYLHKDFRIRKQEFQWRVLELVRYIFRFVP